MENEIRGAYVHSCASLAALPLRMRDFYLLSEGMKFTFERAEAITAFHSAVRNATLGFKRPSPFHLPNLRIW